MNKDALKEVSEIESIAKIQMQSIKKIMEFRVGEDEKYVKMYSSMYKNMLQRLSKEEQENAEAIEKLKSDTSRQAQMALLRYRKSMLSQMSAEERASALADAKAKKEAELNQNRKAMMEKIAMATAEYADKEQREREIGKIKREYEAKEKKGRLEISRLSDEISKAELSKITDAFRQRQAEASAKKAAHEQDKKFLKEKLQGEGSFIEKAKATQKFLKENPLNMKLDVEAAMKKNEEAQAAYGAVREENLGNIEELNKTISQMESVLNDPTKDAEAKEAAQKQLEEAQASKAQNLQEIKDAAVAANKASMEVAMGKLQEAISGAYKHATEQAETILNDYMGVIDGRMQGSDKSFKKMSDTITSKLATSPFVKSTQVLEKLKEASELGLSYNTEQRAFLAEVSEKIANTFDAFDSNLLRIIRLQQADTTATRLGMEASLTKLFNGMFQDSSYLKNLSDSISSALIDANSQLNHEASAEFEFVVQKWLGALSSLGMGDNSLTQIATGLNYLATGNVQALANDTALQTVFAMAASNANMEYSDILLHGLDASNTNRLLESMVLYLKDIAENSDNQVVKAAYGDIFNMSLSDMKAISNLTSQEIATLAGTNMSYSDMKSEIDNQMNQLWNRTSLAAMMTNVFDNVIYSVASDMTNNPVTFAMQKMLNFMDETKTDINIPFINAMGFGLDLNASVKDLMQMGLGIGQAFSLTGNILSGLSSGGGTDLDAWGATETTKRGTGLNLMSGSTLGGVSGSIGTYATSGNSSDIKNSTMSSATDDSEESKKITNKNSKAPENTIDDLMKAVVGVDASDYVLTQNSTLEKVYEGATDSLKVTVNGLTLQEGLLRVRDDKLIELVSNRLTEISNYLSEASTKTLSVTIADIPDVAIDKNTVIEAVRAALYEGDSSKNFTKMIDKVVNGKIDVGSVSEEVAVKNGVTKLQVSNLVW